MTAEGSSSWVGLARRAGYLDPLALGALATAATMWGASSATPYAAAATRHPGRAAVIDEFGSISYAKLEIRTTRLAAALRSAGVKSDAVVGLLCRNHRGFIEANIGVAKLGARVVYLNTALPAAQLDEVISREGVSMVIGDRDLLPQRVVHGVKLMVADPGASSSWSFPTLSPPRIPLVLPRPINAPTPVILTSGTSGAPKGTQRSANGRAAAGALGFLQTIPYTAGDVFAVPAPLFHAWGLSQMLLAASLFGTVVLRQKFDPAALADDVEQHEVDVLAAVPVMLHRLLEANLGHRLKRLRISATSGSALPAGLSNRWMEAVGDNLYSLYGSTEVGQVAAATPNDLRRDPATAGAPLPGIEVRILDEAGGVVGVDVVGRIAVKSEAHFDGYTGGGSKEVADGHMLIGDQGFLDADGKLTVLGRADDMIISGGENLFPSNIERALLQHPAVVEAVVVGIPDPDLGQRVRAVVVGRSSGSKAKLTESKLRTFLSEHLAKFEVPREIVFVDQLPRNPAGKVLRRQLV